MPKKINIIRPTFEYEKNGIKYDIKAGGVLFYKKIKEDTFLLMIRNRGKLEDFGGCSDAVDADIYDMIAREVEEESNKLFNKENIRERIIGLEPIIVKLSKYILFLVPLLDEEMNFKESDFGTMEIHDNINRTVEWVNACKFNDIDFFQTELNFRLKLNILQNTDIWL